RSAKVTAEQEQNRWRVGERASYFTMETSTRARGIGVEVRRWMRLRCFARAIGKLLFQIASARVENGQTKMRLIIMRHRKGTVSDVVGRCEADQKDASNV